MNVIPRSIRCALLVISGSWQAIRAADGESPTGVRPLFNGRDLTGWSVDGYNWRVEQGEIVTVGQDHRTMESLLSDRDYTDFLLRFEFKLVKNADSGVQIRAVPGERVRQHPFHLEVNIHDDASIEEGGGCPTGSIIWCSDGSTFQKPAQPARLKPCGEWNEMEVELRGQSLRVAVNGLTIQTADLGEYKGMEFALPGLSRTSGRIGFQRHTNEVHFRNISIQELKSPTGVRPLFNGRDLTGWSVDGYNWRVEQGEIVTVGQDHRTMESLLSDRDYTDFLLRFEFKLVERADSGVEIRALPGERVRGRPFHLEVNIRDDASFEGGGDFATGSLNWCSDGRTCQRPAQPARLKPRGEWNEMEVELRGQSLRVAVNGEDVQKLNLSDFEGMPLALPGLRRTAGRIGFQRNANEVRFRNISLEELGSGSGPSLYVLSIGINDYPDKRLKLDCAAPDARDIRQAFLTHSKRQFPGGVQTRLLLDGQATRDNILEGLQWLASKVKGNDVAVVFYAGHGDSQIEGQFYLVPFDANLRKLKASGISGASLRKALGDLPSTTMLILDACDSGAFDPKAPKTRKVRALPTATDTMLRQMVNDEGLVVMCGAAKGMYAIEENGHGFFTRAIVDGLSGKADVYKKGRVDLIDLQGYVVNRVDQLSSGDQVPTFSIPSTIRSFPLAKP